MSGLTGGLIASSVVAGHTFAVAALSVGFLSISGFLSVPDVLVPWSSTDHHR